MFCSTGNFMPHGGCYLWTQSLIALHAVSDAFIALAYYSIPVTLFYLVRKRKDLKFHWMFMCFAVFILACGTSHLLEVWNIWHADYWLSGGVKAVTALASVPTAFLLVKLVPQLLALPSADALKKAHTELEQRVHERTAELEDLNNKLKVEIAGHQRTETALRESEELFSKAFRASPDCLVIARLADRTVIRANEALCRLWGSTPEGVIGKPGRDYSTWLSETERELFVQRLQATGECLDYETVMRLADGRLRDFNLSSRLITLHGEACVLTVMRDITEQKKIEAAEARLAAIVQSSDDAIIGKDLEGTITSWNLGAEIVFGYAADEMIGQKILRLIPPERWQEEADILTRVRAGEGVRHFDTVRLRKDGRRIDVSITTSAIKDASGKIIGASKVARDISERKRTEAERAKLAALVEHSQDFITLADLDGRVTFMNSGGRKLIGLRDEQASAGLNFTDYVPPAGQDFFRDTVIATVRAEGIWQGEMQLLHLPTGECLDVVRSTFLLRDAAGEPYSFATVARDVTEAKRAERTLRENEGRMRLATEATGVGIWEWNVLTQKIHWDAEMFRIYGLTPTADGFVEYRTWADAVLPEDLAEQERILQDTLRRSGRSQREFRIRRPGEPACRHIEAVETVRTNTRGQTEWVVGTNLDITARKLAETELRETQARLNSTLAAGLIGTWTWDIVRDNLVADEFTARMFSLDASAAAHGLPAAAYLKAVAEEDRPAVSEKLAAAIKACGTYDIEYRVRQYDGEFSWLQARGRVEGDAAGNALNFHGAVMDITARKWTEAALRQSEERFRTLANSMSQLAWIAQPDGFILWYNQRWYDYTGTTPAQMEGWGWQTVHDPAVLPRVLETWQSAMQAREPFEMEFPLRGADGKYRRFLTRGQPFKNADGELLQWFGTNTDVEILKQAEEKIQRLNVELEERVVERTAQLEAANKELESFSYSVSHDLRAPLRAVNGFAGIVLEEYGPHLDEQGRRYLERIRNGGQRMGELIDDLLAFSRLSRQPLKCESVDFAQIVAAIREESAPDHAGRLIEWRIGDLPVCAGDPALLKQVWVNLISNAVKYSRGRAPAIIEIASRQQEHEVIYFVRDNGTGFDMRYAHKLFAVFQRLHRADEFEGTGVGLAIVQRILHRHGGRVWVEAVEGQGATFYFTLKPDQHA
jgi:PAS domain S-box-containing protein